MSVALSLFRYFLLIFVVFYKCYSFEDSSTVEQINEGCWANSEIPFKMKGFSLRQRNEILEELQGFDQTCIRWLNIDERPELQNVTRYVLFEHALEGTCQQEIRIHPTDPLTHQQLVVAHIKLPDYCFHDNELLHFIMHVLGFHHEHQRADRDCYVSVGGYQARFVKNYVKHSTPWLERFPYDKRSMMHYKRKEYLRAKTEPLLKQEILGNPTNSWTLLDYWKLMYKFCGREHICDNLQYAAQCAANEAWEQEQNCR